MSSATPTAFQPAAAKSSRKIHWISGGAAPQFAVLKKLALIFVLGAISASGAEAATAYEALQVVKKARGDGILKQLVEVQGETGQPQPQSWTILMSDPAARGGIREFVVTGGEIASERTPVRGYAAGTGGFPALNFSRLNLDSDGAFKVANMQATNARLGFHTVDYTLRMNDADSAPMWVLHLFDYMGAPVGTLEVSAESGKVVSKLQIDPDARQKPVVQATPGKPQPANGEAAEPATHFPGGVFGFVERTSKNVGTKVKDTSINVGNAVKKTTLNVAGTVQEALTGERTIDQDKPSGQ
jgi:hypothetical protein